MSWQTHNPQGQKRVLVTKQLPGTRWLEILAAADCRVEYDTSSQALTTAQIKAAIGARCDGAIGQITERWDEELFATLRNAGGRAYSNYAVGFDNVDVAAATRNGVAVGNTPGVLTETTAELAVALTCAAARRLGEAERFVRAGRFRGWLPNPFMGYRLCGGTVGVIGAGRIGSAYARMMVEGFKMNLIYYNRSPRPQLEAQLAAYGDFLRAIGEPAPCCRRAQSLEELLREADCVSIHTALTPQTRHLIDAARLALMKPCAILVNTSRGPVIDEAALVAHCRAYPEFRAGLDVFEHEPALAAGLSELENVVLVPHIGSATNWTRQGMATLAAANVAALLLGYPAWQRPEMTLFLGDVPPQAAPSIVNAAQLGYPVLGQNAR